MTHDSIHLNPTVEPRQSTRPKLLAALAALLVTGALLAGYAVMRKRHVQHTLAVSTSTEPSSGAPKGPPKAQIIVDEPLLKGGETIIGGRVKNLSSGTLSGLQVHLELRQRKDGQLAESSVPLEPSTLDANQEGFYSVKMPASEYASVRLVGLSADPASTQLAYTSMQGKQRPPERFEPRTIVITKRSSKGDGFLNSPDDPARVP
jgi:hypothetical protein